MAKIYKHVASGNIRSGGSTSAQIIEIWSCSLWSLQLDSSQPLSINEIFAAAWSTFFQSTNVKIAFTCETTEIKSNVIDPTTGLQITDPTVVKDVSYFGKASTVTVPTFQSCRVSLDDRTRNRSARGGFYLPRFSANLGQDGRYQAEDMENLAAAAKTLLNALGTTTGAEHPGIYSKTQKAFYPVSRVRCGNVPDFISRRKNDMEEAYSVALLT